MTKNSARKRAVREHAADTGKRYLDAARDLDGDGPAHAAPQALTIQQSTGNVRDERPLPLHITEHGWVLRQSWWRGEVLFALGFTDEAKPGSITVRWSQAWNDPSLAIGKYPVVADKFGTWSTLNTPVSQTHFIDASFDYTPSVHAEFGADENLVRVDVAPLIQSLEPDEIAEILARRRETRATHYWWAWITDALDLPRDTWKDVEEPFTIRFDEDELVAWEGYRT